MKKPYFMIFGPHQSPLISQKTERNSWDPPTRLIKMFSQKNGRKTNPSDLFAFSYALMLQKLCFFS